MTTTSRPKSLLLLFAVAIQASFVPAACRSDTLFYGTPPSHALLVTNKCDQRFYAAAYGLAGTPDEFELAAVQPGESKLLTVGIGSGDYRLDGRLFVTDELTPGKGPFAPGRELEERAITIPLDGVTDVSRRYPKFRFVGRIEVEVCPE